MVQECDSAEVFRAGLQNNLQYPKQWQNKRPIKLAQYWALQEWGNVDSYLLSVALPRQGNKPFVHCKVLRRSVINDQAWTVCNESSNGDMGVCTRQSSVTGGHPLSAPPLCIIVPSSQLHSISTFHWGCSCNSLLGWHQALYCLLPKGHTPPFSFPWWAQSCEDVLWITRDLFLASTPGWSTVWRAVDSFASCFSCTTSTLVQCVGMVFRTLAGSCAVLSLSLGVTLFPFCHATWPGGSAYAQYTCAPSDLRRLRHKAVSDGSFLLTRLLPLYTLYNAYEH